MKKTKLIRVTTVLSWVESAWKEWWFRSVGFEEADKISKESAEFGTLVHALVEGVLKNETEIHSSDPISQCAREILEYIGINRIEPWFETWQKSLEIEVQDKKLGLVGHFDCLAKIGGKPVIIDFKTSNKMRKSFPLQKAAYAKMANEMWQTNIDEGLTIRSHWTGTKVEFEDKKYTNLMKTYWPVFNSALKVYKYFKGKQ